MSTTSIRRGREADSLWFLDPQHCIHTSGFEGAAFLVVDGTVDVVHGSETVQLVRGEVAFCASADAPEASDRAARLVPLAPLDA